MEKVESAGSKGVSDVISEDGSVTIFSDAEDKIRKLLVTGGVYSFEKNGVELVSEIARLREEGLNDKDTPERPIKGMGTKATIMPGSAPGRERAPNVLPGVSGKKR